MADGGNILRLLDREVHEEHAVAEEEFRLEERKLRIMQESLGALLEQIKTLLVNKTPLGETKGTAVKVINAIISTISKKQKPDFERLRNESRVVYERALQSPELAHEVAIADKAVKELSMILSILDDQATMLSGLKDAINRQDVKDIFFLWQKLMGITSREAGLLNQFRIDEELIRNHVEALARAVSRHVQNPESKAKIISIAELKRQKEARDNEAREGLRRAA
ncbi:hypothetical protein HYV82_00995 [Candidatus Woesearchaeota archaeon]|nr:hypothetical protein [Candidatus Woesearchaeota archaeon]